MLEEYDPFSSDTTFLDQIISDLIDETIQARGIVPVQNGKTDDEIIFNPTDYNTIFQGRFPNYSLVHVTSHSVYSNHHETVAQMIWTISLNIPRSLSQRQNVVLYFRLLITWANAHLRIKFQIKPKPECLVLISTAIKTSVFRCIIVFTNTQYW